MKKYRIAKDLSPEKIIEYIIIFGMLFFLIENASAQSFWSDEMSTIGYIREGTSFIEMIKGYMVDDAVNLPLYPSILYFVYRIVPYGEVYLLMPSILFTILSVIIIGRIGHTCGGESTQLASICIGSISIWLICRGAWDIRCYSLLVLLSAATIYFYIKRLQKESYQNILKYGVSMLFLFYTHWFGALMMISFALVDLYLYLTKKIKLKCIISYLVAGGLFIPWCICMVLTTTRNLTGNNSDSLPPKLGNIKDTLCYLSGGRMLCLIILVAGILIVICKHCRKNDSRNIDIPFILLITCAWVITVVYIYCAYINPKGSFYENKYFFVLIPQTIVVMAYGLTQFRQIFTGKRVLRISVDIVLLMMYFIIMYKNYKFCYEFAQELRMPYRQCAEYLTDTKDIYQKDTLVISAETSNLTHAWYDYYFIKRGKEIPKNTLVFNKNRDIDTLKTWNVKYEQNILNEYNEIIVFSLSFSPPEQFEEFMNQYYVMVEEAYNGSIKKYKLK